MANRVFVHVGAPLTGSPFVRETLSRHRRRLARVGVLYPQSHVGHDAGHLDAVLDVMSLAAPDRAPASGAWDRLAETARDWRRGTVVVSHELLAGATRAQVERIADSLGRAPGIPAGRGQSAPASGRHTGVRPAVGSSRVQRRPRFVGLNEGIYICPSRPASSHPGQVWTERNLSPVQGRLNRGVGRCCPAPTITTMRNLSATERDST